MKKKELENLLYEMASEMHDLLEEDETEEVVIRYNTLRKYYVKLKFIIEEL